MKKPRVAIVGYGNLGKGVESALQNAKHFRLAKIFSNRTGLVSPFGTKFEKTSNLRKYAGKIDILFLCGGSFSDIQKLGPQTIKMFNTIDSFDTHAKLASYISNLDRVAKDKGKVADVVVAETYVEPEDEVVREKHFQVKPMTVDEAIMQMNMIGHNFFVFSNSEKEEGINVVYVRNDGKYGLIVPEK